jgi:hypothetical protein
MKNSQVFIISIPTLSKNICSNYFKFVEGILDEVRLSMF